MSNITQNVGSRIKYFRLLQNRSQEDVAYEANIHNTYLGQIERGEKNPSIVILDRILKALNVSYNEFFEPMDIIAKTDNSIVGLCFELIIEKTPEQQKRILQILKEIDQLMN